MGGGQGRDPFGVRAFFLACALLCAAGAAPSAQRAQRAADSGSLFVEPRTPQELRRRLEAEAVPELFRMLVEGTAPGAAGGEPLRLGDEERALVREALAARARRELVPFLEELSVSTPALPARLAALDLLGRVGSADHLELLVRLCVGEERRALEPELRTSFGAGLGAILARDGAGLGRVRNLLSKSPPALAGAIVDALAGVPGDEATRQLAALLGRTPGLDPLILARLGERSGGHAAEDSVREAVRHYLAHQDADLVCAAARTSGELRDDGAVEALIGLMEHEQTRVRGAAFAALERISGLAYGSDAARWTQWYHAEMRWWDEESESLLVRIERGHGVEFARAARLALEHRLFRDRIAEAFAQALGRRSVEEVELACRALEQLRSRAGVRGLVECLERSEPGVRSAAWKALRAITGAELPPEADSWSSLAG